MTYFFGLLALYLMYYTLAYARLVWKEDNKKWAGVILMFLAASFPALMVILVIYRF